MSAPSTAQTLPAYYGAIQWETPEELKTRLHGVLASYHLPQGTAPDLISLTCPSGQPCYRHTPLSYKKARELLFGSIHLKGSSLDTYWLRTFYCNDQVTNDDLSPNDPLSPLNIPDSKVINAEHTWPQSKFVSGFSKETQKSDLHILLPENSRVNSTRGNHPFGEVQTPTSIPCANAALGRSPEGLTVFEPDDNAKGDVARALFYYSIRYKAAIDANQEKYLRAWHAADPVNADELKRNDETFWAQKTRNPFIDAPELADEIENF